MRTCISYLFRARDGKEISHHHCCLMETQRQVGKWENFIVGRRGRQHFRDSLMASLEEAGVRKLEVSY